jgi:predicted phosphodiesterase
LTALEAVLADLQQTSPDLILHGGDLADGGSRPAETVDRIRDLGWQGVMGNTDEMLCRPESLEEFARESSAPPSLWTAIREIAAATRTMLGEERITWLNGLPRVHIQHPMGLVHASPETAWRAPMPEASDAELGLTYAAIDQPIVVYGHIHRPYIRSIPDPRLRQKIVANTGSVSLSYDGDRRASYLLLDGTDPTIRRVEYDVEKEVKALSGLLHRDWIVKILRTGSLQLPRTTR